MIFAPAISISHSANPSQESPFGFAHSQEEFHTSFAGQVYALWREDQPLLIDFTAHSDVDTNFTWDATGLAGNWGITSNGSTAQVDWQPLLTPGIYELVVTAENSQGQTSVTVWLRISPTSRAWNIRREHTSLYTAHWDGHINTAPVWGANHRGAGYAYFPLDPTCFDCAGSLERYISNGDFIYTAGSTSLYNGGSNSNALINGPQRQLPDGLLTHAAISQLIQGWLQQARDAVEMLNDYIGAFDALLQNQFAQYQYEAEICRRQAEWEASRTWMDDVGDVVGQMWQGVMDTVESDWEFLGIRGRKGGIEFGDLFAIEWAGYGDRAEATWGGAFFQGGDLITLGQYYSDQDRAEMYEYYASRGLENYYMAGGRVSQITITTAAAVATGGAAGGAAGALGARAGYALLAETAVGSASASAIHQQYTTGEVRGDVLAQDTAVGLAFVGAFAGGGRAYAGLRNSRVAARTRSGLPNGSGNPTGLEGGTGRAFAGHGYWKTGLGRMKVPEGSPITIWKFQGAGRAHRGELPEFYGLAIERGRYDLLPAKLFGHGRSGWGSFTALPGRTIPNYRLGPFQSGDNFMLNSRTVGSVTKLRDLLKPKMGHVEWAACTGP